MRFVPISIAATLLCGLVFGLAVQTAHADTLIVLNKSDATATLIDRASNKTLATLPTGDGPHEVAVSPDGKRAVVANYGGRTPGSSLTVIDLGKRKVEGTYDLGDYTRPHGIVFTPDGKQLVVTVEGSRALITVDAQTGKVLRAINTKAEVSHMVALAADGGRAFVANIGSGSVSVLDLKAGKLVRNIPTGAGAEGIDISPDGAEVWVSNRAADTITIIDAKTLAIRATLKCADFPIRVKFTPDGARVLVSNAQSNDVAVFDAKSRKELSRIAMGKDMVPIGILVADDGKTAYVANTQADQISVINLGADLKQWRVGKILKAGRTPDGMAISPL